MTWHVHERANTSIESEWMDVRDVPMRWVTRGPVLDGMTKCDSRWYPETRDGVKTYGPCQWRSRWQDETRWCIERPWPRAEARSSRMTWPSVEASRLCRRRLSMHAQATCVVEQAWIPHKRWSIGENKSCLRSDEAIKLWRKIYMGLNSP